MVVWFDPEDATVSEYIRLFDWHGLTGAQHYLDSMDARRPVLQKAIDRGTALRAREVRPRDPVTGKRVERWFDNPDGIGFL
jgi:hypothetical protein